MTAPPISSQTKRGAFSGDELQGQVDRISRSQVFGHSQTLQRLLRYLASKSIEAPGGQIKEYTIGVEALERRPSFDPKEDTIVRVQIHRLREKLLEYYEAEGVRDPILVTIPKGRYLPSFEVMAAPLSPPQESAPHAPEVPTGKDIQATELEIDRVLQGGSRRRLGSIAVLCTATVVLVIISFLAGWRLRSRWTDRTGGDQGLQLSSAVSKTDPVRAFWAAFLGND